MEFPKSHTSEQGEADIQAQLMAGGNVSTASVDVERRLGAFRLLAAGALLGEMFVGQSGCTDGPVPMKNY
jgi:hypothetical protein